MSDLWGAGDGPEAVGGPNLDAAVDRRQVLGWLLAGAGFTVTLAGCSGSTDTGETFATSGAGATGPSSSAPASTSTSDNQTTSSTDRVSRGTEARSFRSVGDYAHGDWKWNFVSSNAGPTSEFAATVSDIQFDVRMPSDEAGLEGGIAFVGDWSLDGSTLTLEGRIRSLLSSSTMPPSTFRMVFTGVDLDATSISLTEYVTDGKPQRGPGARQGALTVPVERDGNDHLVIEGSFDTRFDCRRA